MQMFLLTSLLHYKNAMCVSMAVGFWIKCAPVLILYA